MAPLDTHNLAVQIVRWIEDYQPGIVACEILDAHGGRHTIIDKLPYFTAEYLDSSSEYPRPGSIRCEVLSQWRDEVGRDLARISLARPYDMQSTEGLSEFVVLASQLSVAP